MLKKRILIASLSSLNSKQQNINVMKNVFLPLARLRKPQDGLFTGQIDAVDTVNYSYRVTFDRPGMYTPDETTCMIILCSTWSYFHLASFLY